MSWGKEIYAKGTESIVHLCCGLRQRLGELLRALGAKYSSAVPSVRETGTLLRAMIAMACTALLWLPSETGKLLRALRAMYSSAVPSVREDAGCSTEDSFCPVGLKQRCSSM